MRSLSVAVAVLALLPAAAAADSRMAFSQGEVSFLNEDAGVANKLLVEPAQNGSSVRFYDTSDPYGIAQYPTPPCSPGQLNSQNNPVEIFCTAAQVKTISIDLGPNTDSLDYKAKQAVTASGGTGADHLVTGSGPDFLSGDQGNDYLDGGAGDDELRGEDGSDEIHGGAGNDKIFDGPGADTLDGGDGDDAFSTADGAVDKVACGPGNDTVRADTVDEVAADCEGVQRQYVAPPADQPAADDRTAPTLKAGGSTLQKVSLRRRVLRVAATSSEKGLIQITGYLDAGGINDRVRPAQARIAVAGQGAPLPLRLTRTQVKRALKDLRRGRHPRVRVTISAVDEAGNTSRAKHFWIALTR